MFVARDQNGNLYFFVDKPCRYFDEWKGLLGSTQINKYLFSDLKWESDPLEVELRVVES